MNKRVLNYRPAVVAFLACAGGVLSAALSVKSFIWIVLFILLAAGCAVCLIRKKHKVFFALLFSLLAFSSFIIAWEKHSAPDIDVQDKYILGRVCAVERERQSGTVYILENVSYDTYPLRHKTLLICSDGAVFEVGDNVAVYGDISGIEPNLFDSYGAKLLTRAVRYEAQSEFTVSRDNGKLKLFEKIKAHIYGDMEKYLPFDTQGIAASLLFGDKSSLSDFDAQNFKVSGLSHIFAVSGLHVAFFAALLFFFFKKLNLSPRTTFFCTLGVLLFYGALSGFEPGVNRAIIMTLIVSASTLFYKRVDPLSSLCAAGIILLIIKPFNLFDISFLLSFSAVAGIAVFYGDIRMAFLKTNKSGDFVSSSLALSLSANSLLLPVIVNAFNVFALYFCIANLIVLPVVSLAFIMLILSVVINAILPFTGALYKIAGLPLYALRLLSSLIASLPLAEIEVGGMGVITFFYISVLLLNSKFFMLPKERKLRYSVALIFCFILLEAIL